MRKQFKIKPTNIKNKYVEISTELIWYKTQIRVLYADTDTARVVYHANYLRFFEIGRAEILRDYGASYKMIEDKNIFHPIVKVNMDFYSGAKYDEMIDIYVRPKILETVRFTFDYRLLKQANEQLLVSGITVHCCTIEGMKVCEVDDITKGLFFQYKATQL